MNVAYQFYKLSKGEYFVLSSFLPYLEKEEAKARESAGEREEVPEDPFASGFAPEKEREAKGGAGGLSGSEWPEDTRAEIERPPSKKSWLSRLLFGRRERHKKTAKEELPEEAWPDTVWDSYAGQLDPKGTGETVYFTDLERKQEGGKTACLEEEGGGRRFPLRELPMTVGKLKGRVSIELTDSSVSRIHARLLVSEGGIHVLDLNSRNGTIVNGRKPVSYTHLKQRDAWDILQRPAQWLWEKREARGRPVGSAAARKRMEALSALYGQARAGEEYRQFQIGKYERLLALFLTGTALTAALLGAFWLRGKEALTALERPATGEGSKNLSLNLQIGDEPPARVHLDVPERALTPEEEEWLLAEAADRLSSQMEGDGWKPDAVSSDIALPGELCGGLVEVCLLYTSRWV